MKRTSDSPRSAAAVAVERICGGGAYSNLVLGGAKLRSSERPFYTALVRGTVERLRTLRFVVGLYARRPPDRMTEAILCTGIYQILYMDKVPDSAACNESVRVARELVSAKEAGFVNAVLRSVCRDQASLPERIAAQPDGVRYSLSDSLCARLRAQYPEQSEDVFASFFEPDGLPLCVNTRRITVRTLADRLTAEGIEYAYTDDGLPVVVSGAEKALGMLNEGLFFVQGVASRRAVRTLGAEPGMTVLDVCACPGGKTLSAAIDMNDSGVVQAFDLHANKLSLIEKSARTLGLSCIRTGCRDARDPASEWVGTADRVICDVPCTSIGVIAAKPEIRYKDVTDISSLTAAQRDILAASASYLRSGGVLVYSTCSLDARENGEIVRAFLKDAPGFELAEERQTLPCEPYCDGFYAAKIIKK